MKNSLKKILYIGYNFSPELTGIGKYSGEMMVWLAKKGYNCTVITGYPYYPEWEIQPVYKSKRFWFSKEVKKVEKDISITVYRCPMYVPRRPIGITRILSDFSFFCSSILLLIVFAFKPKRDVVISVAPTFLSGLLGVAYKKLKGAKHIHHIQDLQIEAATKLNLIKSKSLIRGLFALEAYIFENSDKISSISESMMNRIKIKCKKEVSFFPNWSDTKTLYPIGNKRDLKIKFGYNKDDTIVLYSGAIGEKQGLEAILTTAKELITNKSLKFLICGSGPYKSILSKKAENMGLNNVFFLPLQPKDIFNEFLNMADYHLVIQKADTSDLVMPSKLTSILAVGGVAVVTANPKSELFDLINKYQMGFLVKAEDQCALTHGIKKLVDNENDYNYSLNATTYARKFLSMENIMENFQKNIISA
ncbi:MAG: WcaI family glycosyltransferase [Maribacter stanieri]